MNYIYSDLSFLLFNNFKTFWITYILFNSYGFIRWILIIFYISWFLFIIFLLSLPILIIYYIFFQFIVLHTLNFTVWYWLFRCYFMLHSYFVYLLLVYTYYYFISVCVCKWWYLCVYVSDCMYLYVYSCVYTWVCVYLCMCVCLYTHSIMCHWRRALTIAQLKAQCPLSKIHHLFWLQIPIDVYFSAHGSV